MIAETMLPAYERIKVFWYDPPLFIIGAAFNPYIIAQLIYQLINYCMALKPMRQKPSDTFFENIFA